VQLGPRTRIALEAAAAYVVCWVFLYGLQYQTPAIPEPDGYYHIKVASLIRQHGFVTEFPWAAFSAWRDTYVDKELGFHLLLVPFTLGDLVTGAKLAAVSFGALVFASLYAIGRARELVWPWLWTVLATAGGSYFLWRVDTPRPQIIAITLSLWTMFAIVTHRPRLVFALAWIYALSYTAPFVVVGYALVYVLWHRGVDGAWRWRLVLAAIAGVCAGWIINPFFPHDVINVWRQSVDVLGSAWHSTRPSVAVATELLPMTTRQMLVEHLALVVPGILALFALTRLRGKLSAELLTLVTITLGYGVLACLGKRFIEYAVPFALWTLGHVFTVAWRDAVDSREPFAATIQRRGTLVAAIVLVACMGLFWRSYRATQGQLSLVKPSMYRLSAVWLAKNAPRDTVVFTCDWDDAPELLFHNDHNRYLVFLDPMYMASWDGVLWNHWRALATDPPPDVLADIKHTFGASHGVCTQDFTRMHRAVASEIVYEDSNVYVFRVP
jgi:hypothetical protein